MEDYHSFKGILIGGNKFDITPEIKKEAVKYIIKSNIINYNKFYWIEASDVIKHWHEKYGAYKVPAQYAKEILNRSDITIENEYEYSRIIPGVDYPVTKIMYGFPTQEFFNEILKKENYYHFQNEVEKLYNEGFSTDIFETFIQMSDYKSDNKIKYPNVKKVIHVVSVLNMLNETDRILYDITPATKTYLNKITTNAYKVLNDSKFKETSFSYSNFLDDIEELEMNIKAASVLELKRYW